MKGIEEIPLYDFEKDQLTTEQVFFEKGSYFLYHHPIGKRLMKSIIRKPWVSKWIGAYKKSRFSKREIKPFIQKYQINVDEINDKLENFSTFNDFFIRKLKPDARHIDQRPNFLISPADSKLLVYQMKKDTVIAVKGKNFTIGQLLENVNLAKKYRHGLCLVYRLAPVDYHRYCYIDDGYILNEVSLKGHLDSVNRIALSTSQNIFCENHREYCILKTKNFGHILHMDVGAFGVGRIVQHEIQSKMVKRGDEKGYFEFGGSTIIQLLEKQAVHIDPSILEYSKQGIETIVKYGMAVGKK